MFIPGNSDLRCSQSADEIAKTASPCISSINGISFFAVNDSDGTVAEDDIRDLNDEDDSSIVFMHHPIGSLSPDSRRELLN